MDLDAVNYLELCLVATLLAFFGVLLHDAHDFVLRVRELVANVVHPVDL